MKEKMNGVLKFLNHASYMYESNDFIFICDPWLEGTAFNNGWQLLDQSTSNDDLLSYLVAKKKPVCIWYSHEHSDHFAVPFLKKLSKTQIQTQFVFQTTHDSRIVDYLKKSEFSVSVLQDGERFNITDDSWISIWAWKSGDSFALMKFKDRTILNLNDCIVANDHDSLSIKRLINNSGVNEIDILFTQFGYANWCGNEFDTDLRKNEAKEKLTRIASQIKLIEPKNLVLFASYIYFSHKENFYLNDMQNTPMWIRKNHSLSKMQDRIFFLKPHDKFYLDDNLRESLKSLTSEAESHWQNLYDEAVPVGENDEIVPIEAIFSNFKEFRKNIFHNFLWVFAILELVGAIKSLRVKLVDTDDVITLSYVKSIAIDSETDNWDISMTSSVLSFSLKHFFGFDSTHVNGRFRTRTAEDNRKFLYFAGPQNMLKTGFGIKRPIATIKEFWRIARRKG